jgi:hypothetical protein
MTTASGDPFEPANEVIQKLAQHAAESLRASGVLESIREVAVEAMRRDLQPILKQIANDAAAALAPTTDQIIQLGRIVERDQAFALTVVQSSPPDLVAGDLDSTPPGQVGAVRSPMEFLVFWNTIFTSVLTVLAAERNEPITAGLIATASMVTWMVFNAGNERDS